MKQFLKITKTKINIFFVFLALSFVWGSVTGILYRAIIKAGSENPEYYAGNIFQIIFLILLFMEFYLFSSFAIYLIKKEKKIILSVSELKQFLKISKTKIAITFSLIILSFTWATMIAYLYRAILNSVGFENTEYYMDHVFPIPFYILSILKFYLFTCLAVYLTGKEKKL